MRCLARYGGSKDVLHFQPMSFSRITPEGNRNARDSDYATFADRVAWFVKYNSKKDAFSNVALQS